MTNTYKYRHEYYLKNKEKIKKHNKSIHGIMIGRLACKKYHDSIKGQLIAIKWHSSTKGKISDFNHNHRKNGYIFHGPLNNLKLHDSWIIENCAICNSSQNIEMHHPNYKLPFHIYFLCRKHHKDQHIQRY